MIREEDGDQETWEMISFFPGAGVGKPEPGSRGEGHCKRDSGGGRNNRTW